MWDRSATVERSIRDHERQHRQMTAEILQLASNMPASLSIDPFQLE